MQQAKLVKREAVAQPKPEQPAQPAQPPLPAAKTLKNTLMGRIKTAEAARTDARMAFEALFVRA